VLVGLVSGERDSVRTRRGELASRRKASEASRKIIGVSESNFSVELLVVQDKALTKRLMGECAAATKIYRINNFLKLFIRYILM